jgi:UDP-N-acetylmuramoyl-L-alanyl-D-glutamate--2,6-diaminopimelate ligase
MDEVPLTLEQLRSFAPGQATQVAGNAHQVCTHVTQDSRRVRPGAMFAVTTGKTHDGAAYVADALAAGAQSLLLERSGASEVLSRFPNVPALIVEDSSAALGPLSHAALGHPARFVAVTGITGTNGKTTIVGLVRQCWEALGVRAASLGTLGYRVGSRITDFGMTTPNADLVAEYVHQARLDGATELAMEVSSHALALGRVEGLNFAVGGYINLTQDHLDFHGTFAEYAAAKRRLFEAGRCDKAVILTDDPALAQVADELSSGWGAQLLRVGSGKDAALRLRSVTLGLHETAFSVEWQGRVFDLRTQLVGAHNVSNWLVTLGVLMARGVDVDQLQAVVPNVAPAPGRLERCDTAPDDVTVLVDYAHTPDALERALQACHALGARRVWCVFGCGGDRDRTKRPLMGEIASRLADVAIITNDNPRTESPETIAAEIAAGVAQGNAEVILDRATAIERAVVAAQSGDLVLIAGKGHEDYQIFGRTKVNFDDRQVAASALAVRRARAAAKES